MIDREQTRLDRIRGSMDLEPSPTIELWVEDVRLLLAVAEAAKKLDDWLPRTPDRSVPQQAKAIDALRAALAVLDGEGQARTVREQDGE